MPIERKSIQRGKIIRHNNISKEIALHFLSSSAPAGFYQDNIEEEYPIAR
jgi:hypothetical protein